MFAATTIACSACLLALSMDTTSYINSFAMRLRLCMLFSVLDNDMTAELVLLSSDRIPTELKPAFVIAILTWAEEEKTKKR